MKKILLPTLAICLTFSLFAALHAPIPTWLAEIAKIYAQFQANMPEEKVYLQTDKPFYRPGETIWFAAHVRNASDFSTHIGSEILYIEWWNPEGKKVMDFALPIEKGAATGDISLATAAVGGIYHLKAYTNWQKNDSFPAIFDKEITVQAIILPRLKMKLDFAEKGYGKGATAHATLSLENNENQPLKNFPFSYKIQLSGVDFLASNATTNAEGKADIRFQLPQDLQTNDALLNIVIDYEGKKEAISRSVPIVLQKIDIQFFPEGGDFVANAQQKIAFRAVNEYGKATDVKGYVSNQKGMKVADFESFQRGLGTFSLKGKMGESYTAHITEPQDIEISYPLPQVLATSYALSIEKTDKFYIYTRIFAPQKGEIGIFASVRGENYHVGTLQAQKGENTYQIPLDKMPAGVAHITLFDPQKQPQAERLVFVNRDKQLHIKLKTDKQKYMPREKVNLSVELTNENGQPVAGNVSLAVTDDAFLSFADDKSSHLLTWMLFESEITGKVGEPRLFWDENDPKSAQALDLLLLTSGWRRFSWKTILQEKAKIPAFSYQKRSIKGVVRDAITGKTLPYSFLEWTNGSKSQTTANEKGEFSFPPTIVRENNFLHVAYKGYASQTLQISGYPDSVVFLLQDSLNLAQNTVSITTTPVPRYEKEVSYSVQSTSNGKSSPVPVLPPMSKSNNTTPTTTEKGRASYLNAEELRKEMPHFDCKDCGEDVIIRDYKVASKAATSNTNTKLKNDEFAMQEANLEAAKLSKMTPEQKQKHEEKNMPISIQTESKVGTTQTERKPPLGKDGKPLVDKNGKPVMGEEVGDAPAFIQEPKTPAKPEIQNNPDEPDPTKFIPSAKQPRVLNLGNVQQNIGYPPTAREASIEGNLVFRILIDENGKYIRHLPPKAGHPILIKAVEAHIAELEFEPATQGDKKIKFWVNIPFSFKIEGGQGHIYPIAYPAVKGKTYNFHVARTFPAIVYDRSDNVAVRNDFRSTIYWNGNVQLGANGKANLTFYNSDNISSFRIIAEGFSENGLAGRGESVFYTQMPLDISFSLPVTATVGDTLSVPITFVNHTDSVQEGVLHLRTPKNMMPLFADSLLDIPANQAITIERKYFIQDRNVESPFLLNWQSSIYNDRISKNLSFSAAGFPEMISISDQTLSKTFEINIENPIANTLSAEIVGYPSLIGGILAGMEGILREPHGCFEQTTSATFPNVLVLQLLRENNVKNPAIEQKALQMIENGYKRLISFECKTGGFEWFGNDPAHEGLTAYGLMEFIEMQKVYGGVDKEMVARTKKWLHSRTDGNGNFVLNMKAVDGFSKANKGVIDPFVIYAMSEIGDKGFEKELMECYKAAKKENNPYMAGLVANALLNYGKTAEADVLLTKMWTELQAFDNDKTYTACGSSGNGYKVESYALALMAFLKNETINSEKIQTCLQYIVQSRQGNGHFGNASATVMALRALIAYQQQYKPLVPPNGTVILYVDGQRVSSQKFQTQTGKNVIINDFTSALTKGKHLIRIEWQGIEKAIPFTFSAKWQKVNPASSEKCAIDLTTKLLKNTAKMGETLRLTANISNKTNDLQPMTIAEIPLPSGLSAQPWQLKELQEKGIFDFYEMRQNTLVVYYRFMNPAETKTFSLDLKTEFSGTFYAPAASAYLYYTPEHKDWVSLGSVMVK